MKLGVLLVSLIFTVLPASMFTFRPGQGCPNHCHLRDRVLRCRHLTSRDVSLLQACLRVHNYIAVVDVVNSGLRCSCTFLRLAAEITKGHKVVYGPFPCSQPKDVIGQCRDFGLHRRDFVFMGRRFSLDEKRWADHVRQHVTWILERLAAIPHKDTREEYLKALLLDLRSTARSVWTTVRTTVTMATVAAATPFSSLPPLTAPEVPPATPPARITFRMRYRLQPVTTTISPEIGKWKNVYKMTPGGGNGGFKRVRIPESDMHGPSGKNEASRGSPDSTHQQLLQQSQRRERAEAYSRRLEIVTFSCMTALFLIIIIACLFAKMDVRRRQSLTAITDDFDSRQQGRNQQSLTVWDVFLDKMRRHNRSKLDHPNQSHQWHIGEVTASENPVILKKQRSNLEPSQSRSAGKGWSRSDDRVGPRLNVQNNQTSQRNPRVSEDQRQSKKLIEKLRMRRLEASGGGYSDEDLVDIKKESSQELRKDPASNQKGTWRPSDSSNSAAMRSLLGQAADSTESPYYDGRSPHDIRREKGDRRSENSSAHVLDFNRLTKLSGQSRNVPVMYNRSTGNYYSLVPPADENDKRSTGEKAGRQNSSRQRPNDKRTGGDKMDRFQEWIQTASQERKTDRNSDDSPARIHSRRTERMILSSACQRDSGSGRIDFDREVSLQERFHRRDGSVDSLQDDSKVLPCPQPHRTEESRGDVDMHRSAKQKIYEETLRDGAEAEQLKGLAKRFPNQPPQQVGDRKAPKTVPKKLDPVYACHGGRDLPRQKLEPRKNDSTKMSGKISSRTDDSNGSIALREKGRQPSDTPKNTAERYRLLSSEQKYKRQTSKGDYSLPT